MKAKALLCLAGLVVVGAGTAFVFYTRNAAPPKPDPAFYHTPEGVNATIQAQRAVLSDALRDKDLQFIHGQMYYLQGLADALAPKLEGDAKQRIGARLDEIKLVAEEIDNFSGRGNFPATEASLRKLFEVFALLDAEFKPDKKPAAAAGAKGSK